MLDLEQEMQDYKSFATESFIGTKLELPTTNSLIRVQKEKVEKWLQNPNSNYQQLQDCSKLYMSEQGIYFRLIKMLSVLMTYDYVLIPNISPNLAGKSKYKNKITESFSKASLFLQNLDVRKIAIRFTEDFITDGECYYCKIQDESGIIYQKIPNKYCLPYMNVNGVMKFIVDCSALSSVRDISIFPLEIQNAMRMYKDSKLKKSLLKGQYYLVQDGVCFVNTNEAIHSFPPLSFMFVELLSLKDKKNLKHEIDKISNVKMIHNKVESGKDGKPVMDIKVAKKYNDAIKGNLNSTQLGKLVFSITNPFDSQLLNLKNDSGNNTSEMITKAVTELYDEIGINENLFNSNSTSTEAMKRSIITATTIVINLMFNKIKDYINYELSNLDTDVKMFAKFYDCNIYNREEFRKSAKEGMLVGGSKLEYLCFTYTPLESNNLLNLEKILGINELFRPLQTSYTLTNKDSGRKSSEEMKEDGQEVNDITESQD